MGFFSWKTADTGESIANIHAQTSTSRVRPVYLYKPKGGWIKETSYDGYGVFGGRDAHALLAYWNAPQLCTGQVDEDRLVGIELEEQSSRFPGSLKFPLKFSFSPNKSYSALPASQACPDQGYFYDD